MFGKRMHVFDVFGFSIYIDWSWFVIAALITWSLATGFFPSAYPTLEPSVCWWMGLVGAVSLFASVVFHELSHAMVAQYCGMRMKGITLFIFGGVAEMNEEPPSAKSEFWVAIAGPIASGVLAFAAWFLSDIGAVQNWAVPVYGVLSYLGLMNGVLALFNLVPAFPLDGGRVLRSALWRWKDNLRWATRIASHIGSAFGIGLILLGVLSIFSGNFVGGIWWGILGLFLKNAAGMSYQQLLVRRALEGEPVRRFMADEPVTVSPSLSVKELVDEYVYRYHHKMYPVVDKDRLVGCVTTREVKSHASEEWTQLTVGDVAHACGNENTVSPDTDAMAALSKMNRSGRSRLMVVTGDRLVGILALKDMLEFLSLKVELETAA